VGSTRLGRREKDVLKVLLKLSADRAEDRPLFNLKAGEILGAEIFDELGVPFITLSTDGKPYREALSRLVKRGFVELVSQKRRQVRKRTYKLTGKGREAAESLKAEEERVEGLKETLRLLRAEGHMTLTMDEICELLWQVSGYMFKGREEFERYWNRTKLGLVLRDKMGITYTRIGKRKVQTYDIEGWTQFRPKRSQLRAFT